MKCYYMCAKTRGSETDSFSSIYSLHPFISAHGSLLLLFQNAVSPHWFEATIEKPWLCTILFYFLSLVISMTFMHNLYFVSPASVNYICLRPASLENKF